MYILRCILEQHSNYKWGKNWGAMPLLLKKVRGQAPPSPLSNTYESIWHNYLHSKQAKPPVLWYCPGLPHKTRCLHLWWHRSRPWCQYWEQGWGCTLQDRACWTVPGCRRQPGKREIVQWASYKCMQQIDHQQATYIAWSSYLYLDTWKIEIKIANPANCLEVCSNSPWKDATP